MCVYVTSDAFPRIIGDSRVGFRGGPDAELLSSGVYPAGQQ